MSENNFNGITLVLTPSSKDSKEYIEENFNKIPTLSFCPLCGSDRDKAKKRVGEKWFATEIWEKMSLPIMREMAPSIDAVLRVYGRVFIKELFKINPKNKKVVTFTDSVQGAADFASRFEDEHFINTLRTVIISSSNKLNYGLDELSNEIIIKLIAVKKLMKKLIRI